MFDFLLSIDESVFFFFNKTISNSVFDGIFPFITESDNWMLLYLTTFVWLFWKGGKAGRICGVALILAVALNDAVVTKFLKEFFERERPCRALEGVRMLVGCGPGKSFPSAHASNNFAAAYVFSRYFRKMSVLFYVIAALMAFSRIYVGVHYPSDVIGGAIVGVAVGFVVVMVIDRIVGLFEKGKS